MVAPLAELYLVASGHNFLKFKLSVLYNDYTTIVFNNDTFKTIVVCKQVTNYKKKETL